MAIAGKVGGPSAARRRRRRRQGQTDLAQNLTIPEGNVTVGQMDAGQPEGNAALSGMYV